MCDEPLAIEVCDLSLSYGFRRPLQVMHHLQLQMPVGAIYGLLGPSGCGKTSLIRCILGSVRPTTGVVRVFGSTTVPGAAVGYMPQEVTLHHDLTVAETLQYYGSLVGLSTAEARERTHFLVRLLNLPNRLIGSLSGGQKRRASLAVALVHRPPLLILDEPTVGVDPVLRRSIWSHLTELSRTERTTVLITTHYIEEARAATLVGFMRDGRILRQESPTKLLQHFRVDSLEQVFLRLCLSEEEESQVEHSHNNNDHITTTNSSHCFELEKSESNGTTLQSINTGDRPDSVNKTTTTKPKSISVNALYRIAVMVWKHLRCLVRSPVYLIFQFLLPMVQGLLFCTVMGRDLHSIPVAVFDGDNSTLSRAIVAAVQSPVVFTEHFATELAAIQSVVDGLKFTALILQPGFEACLFERMTTGQQSTAVMSAEVLANSTLLLYPDMSNQIMVQFVHRETLAAFGTVTKSLVASLGHDPRTVDFPVQLATPPVYGTANQPYLEFLAPAFLASIAFFASLTLTSLNLVTERISGLVERTTVTGVSHAAIVLSHMLTFVAVLLVQDSLLLAIIVGAFGLPTRGNLVWIAVLTALQSGMGMTIGLLISAVASSERMAGMLALGLFYPMLMLSGTIWPSESMPDALRYFTYGLPITVPIRSMRFLMIRGWGIEHWAVALGFVTSGAWIVVASVFASVVFKFVC